MSNKYQIYSPANPIPLKTFIPNSILWTSLEEAIAYTTLKREKSQRKKSSK